MANRDQYFRIRNLFHRSRVDVRDLRRDHPPCGKICNRNGRADRWRLFIGPLSIFLLVAVLFEPLLTLIAANVFLRLTAAVTQPIGESRIPDFLTETADNLNYCTAGLLFVAFLYFLTVVLVICSSEVVF